VGRYLPPPGKQILLRTGKLSILGRIVWANHDHRGIIFEDPQPEAVKA
jgi:hypothetical protein